jgi:hypothetical protein
MRFLRRFAHFWYDFIVGGRPELPVGVILALVVTSVAVRIDIQAIVIGMALFASIAALGIGSVWYRSRSRSVPPPPVGGFE